MASDSSQNVQFYLRGPKGPRKSFAIIQRQRGTKGKYKTVKNETIKHINQQLKSGTLTLSEAREAAHRELERVRETSLPKTKKQTMRPANERLLKKYWKDTHLYRDLVSPDASWNRLRRAVEALEDTPLTADKSQLQSAINQAFRGKPHLQRTSVGALNQILRWMGRGDIKLTQAKKPPKKVRHISLADFEKNIGTISDHESRMVLWVAISTGARAGEIFAMDRRNWSPDERTIYIDAQLTRELQYRDPKNMRHRHVPVLEEGVKWLEEWLDVPESEKKRLRNMRWADQANLLDSDQKLTFHDLRHSYAIYLLHKEVSVSLVAYALGDSIAVAEEHYLGIGLKPEGIKLINQALGRKS